MSERDWSDSTLADERPPDGSRATKPIEQIREGDKVLSADPRTGKVGPREVVRLFPGFTDQVCKVVVAARRPLGRTEAHRVGLGSGAGESSEDAEPPPAEQEILCTPNHPFWRERSQDFVPANTLRSGDRLRSEDGEPLEVRSVDLRQEWTRTWNFEVEGWHTYFVAGEPNAPAVWVHNACRTGWDRFQEATRGQFTGPNNRAAAATAWNQAKTALARGVGRMPKPTGVADPRLQNIVENLYHGAGRTPMLGHGGTADAARIELATGVRIFGRDHAGNSAPQLMRALENWERRYGGAASAADRKIAQDLWGDLVNALAGF